MKKIISIVLVVIMVLSTNPVDNFAGSITENFYGSGPIRSMTIRQDGMIVGGRSSGNAIEVWGSSDKGNTWSRIGSVAQNDNVNYGDVMFLAVPNTNTVFCAFREYNNTTGHYAVTVCRSDDGGYNWVYDSTVIAGCTEFVGAPWLFIAQNGDLQCYYDSEPLATQNGVSGAQWIAMQGRNGLTGSWDKYGVVAASRDADASKFIRDGMASVVDLGNNRIMLVTEGIEESTSGGVYANVVRAIQSFDGGYTWNYSGRRIVYQSSIDSASGRRYNAYCPMAIRVGNGPVGVVFCTDEDFGGTPDASNLAVSQRRCHIKYIRTLNNFETWGGLTPIWTDGSAAYAPGMIETASNEILISIDHFSGNQRFYQMNAGVEDIGGTQLSNVKNKTFFFLGSSVTYGYASGGVSFADYIAQRNGCTAVKEAVSGTTLVDNGSSSYVQRMINNFDTSAKPDHFICQLSTNDASQGKPLGSMSSSFNLADFDTSTIYGAMEYIICYAKQTWNCPVSFYTGTYYNSANYQAMVDALYQLKGKWGIGIIDLWNNQEMRNISAEDRARYMADDIHPTAVGYEEWWTPVFEDYLQNFNYTNLVEVFGLVVDNPSPGVASVVWGNPENGQLFNVYIDGALAVSTTGATLSNVACGYYTIPTSEGTHTIRVTGTLNGEETPGTSLSVTVSGSSNVETPAVGNVDLTGYVTAGPNWNDLSYWSVYFASGWANDPTGSYKAGNSYNDFGLYVNSFSGVQWGIQMKTQVLGTTIGNPYVCKITATLNTSMSNTIILKDEGTQVEKTYALTNGTNTLELEFTPTANNTQIFLELSNLPAGSNFVITGFSLIDKNAATEPPTEAPTEAPTEPTIFDAFERIEAEAFSSNQGGVIDTNNNASGGHNIGGVSNGVTMVYDTVVFDNDAGSIEICYSSPSGTAQGNVEIYLDNMDNKVATIVLENNGSTWQNYGTLTADLESEIPAGTHTIYMKYVTTGTIYYVANVDYFSFIKAPAKGIEINGYQISYTSKGMRTVYSVESEINGQSVVESGLVYSLSDYATEDDLYVGSTHEYVASFVSTDEGKFDTTVSESATATSYAMTMRFATTEAAEYNAGWRVKAYAKLADGTYVYTNSLEYTIFDIAEKLYQEKLMKSYAAHNYLYEDILLKVDVSYARVAFDYKNTIVPAF